MQNFSVEKSLLKAKSYSNKGDIAEAQKLYETILKNFSNNLRAQQGLASLKKYNLNQKTQSPPQEVVDQLVNLYNQGQFAMVAEQAHVLAEQYPYEPVLWNILGASRSQIGMLEEAIDAYKKTISLRPDYAEAYSNMGVAYRNMGKPDEAIDTYKKAISIYPYYAESYNNMGIVLKDQGNYGDAVNAYKKSISLKSFKLFVALIFLFNFTSFKKVLFLFFKLISCTTFFSFAHNSTLFFSDNISEIVVPQAPAPKTPTLIFLFNGYPFLLQILRFHQVAIVVLV